MAGVDPESKLTPPTDVEACEAVVEATVVSALNENPPISPEGKAGAAETVPKDEPKLNPPRVVDVVVVVEVSDDKPREGVADVAAVVKEKLPGAVVEDGAVALRVKPPIAVGAVVFVSADNEDEPTENPSKGLAVVDSPEEDTADVVTARPGKALVVEAAVGRPRLRFALLPADDDVADAGLVLCSCCSVS